MIPGSDTDRGARQDIHNFNETIRRTLCRDGAILIVLGLALLLGLAASGTAQGICMGFGLLVAGFNDLAPRASMKDNPRCPRWLLPLGILNVTCGVLFLFAGLHVSFFGLQFYPNHLDLWIFLMALLRLKVAYKVRTKGLRYFWEQGARTASVLLFGAVGVAFSVQDGQYLGELLLIAAGLATVLEGKLFYPAAADGSAGGEPKGQ